MIATFLASALPAAAVFAADNNAPSLDEQLNIPGATTAPSSHGGTAPGASDGVNIDPGVARRLEGHQPADLFHQALAEMSEASDRMERARDAGAATQRIEESILAKLDQVIATAEQQQQQQQSSSSSSSSQSSSKSGQKQRQENGNRKNEAQQPGNTPGQKPQEGQSQQPGSAKGENRGQNQIAPGGVSATMPGELSQNRSEWGNLPQRVRDQLQEGLTEPYSPIYREMTEQYYRALAEQGR